MEDSDFYGREKIAKILFKIAPPVMLAQLIQALYNIVDSLFVGRYAESGLTALSIIYPIQLLMIALGTPLAIMLWILFAVIAVIIMPAYARMSTGSEQVIHEVTVYGRIVCIFSFGLFLESVWTKILQANGDMRTPMIAQIIGAITNIILDPILIFGLAGIRPMGIAGAAVATVTGQIVAALIVMRKGIYRSPDIRLYPGNIKKIYYLGIPNILMQSAYTFYILGLNLILAGFSDQAVTALGLYYKWQTIFFIPLGALQTCIVPIVSYNYAAKEIGRCRETMSVSVKMGMALMFIGTLCFELIPSQMLSVFTGDQRVIDIGAVAFHYIGVSFIPMVTSLTFPVFFQAIGSAGKSSILTLVRTMVLFVPLGYLFSRIGLNYFWLTFPVTECLTTCLGVYFYRKFIKRTE